MARYTTQIRTIVEAGEELFDFDYPIFDQAYKKVLETNIINTYYFREIGLETVAQFKWYLKARLNLVMPYYNQLYDSLGLITKDDYAINQNSTETHTRTTTTTTTGKIDSTADTTSDGSGKTIYQDTPTSKLGNVDYATNITDSTQEGNDHSVNTSSSEGAADMHESYIVELTGGGGLRYNADVLMEWRKSFINVDQMIIEEISDLFMTIY